MLVVAYSADECFEPGQAAVSHDVCAPCLQEAFGAASGGVGPAVIEVFFEKVGFDGGEIGGEQFAQTGSGRSSEIAAPFEPEPARFCQVRRFIVILEFFDFVASSLVDRRVELLNDVKTVEDVEGVGRSFGDDVEVRFPHIRADKLYSFRSFIANFRTNSGPAAGGKHSAALDAEHSGPHRPIIAAKPSQI